MIEILLITVIFLFVETKMEGHYDSDHRNIFSTGYSMIAVSMLGSTGEQAVRFYNDAHKTVNTVISICAAISAVFCSRFRFIIAMIKGEWLGL